MATVSGSDYSGNSGSSGQLDPNIPEIILFENCTACCSGSAICTCSFFDIHCSESDLVRSACKTYFKANIFLDFSNCLQSPIKTCGSGFGSGQTGSGSCMGSCPSCCDLIPGFWELDMICVGDYLASSNLVDGSCGSSIDYKPSYTCAGNDPLRCNFFWINKQLNFNGQFWIPIDNWGFGGYTFNTFVLSCDPLVISGELYFGRAGAPIPEPCIAACFGRPANSWLFPGVGNDPGCTTGTFIITEA